MAAPFTPLFDEQWIVALVEQIEAIPATDADVVCAYDVGVTDAEQGRPCQPLTHYAKLGDIAEYEAGWHDATFVLGEAADLRDGMEFADFVRGGC